jgi:hypothetical protein
MSSSTQKRAICFIPSGEMLRVKPVKHWLARFAHNAQRSATEAVLPAIGFSGPLYESKVHPFPEKFKQSNLLPTWVKDARENLPEGAPVWATILVDCGFLANEAIWLRNQYDDPLDQMCIVNPVSRLVLQDFIDEIIALGVDGIVFDLTDAFPNSGAAGYKGIISNCFCFYCMNGLRQKGFGEPKEAFVGDTSLLRLVLRIDEDGTAHIDPTQDWIDQRNSSALVTLALAREFVQGDRNELEAEAARLLKYFKSRGELIAETIRSIACACKNANKRAAVILGSAAADLTQLVTLQALDSAKSADEYWLPDAPSREESPGEWQTVQFLATRSSYFFNAFFELIEDANGYAIRHGVPETLKELQHKCKRLAANNLFPGAAYVVDKLDQYTGFVGVPLGREDHLEIIEKLTTEITGSVLPQGLLDQFRIGRS